MAILNNPTAAFRNLNRTVGGSPDRPTTRTNAQGARGWHRTDAPIQCLLTNCTRLAMQIAEMESLKHAVSLAAGKPWDPDEQWRLMLWENELDEELKKLKDRRDRCCT